jgi:hypothetical protein
MGIPEWEPKIMTICIAAICDGGRTIAFAADKEVGIGYTSGDLIDGKFHNLYHDWSIGIADSVTSAMDVIGGAYKLRPTLPSLSVDDVRSGVERSYRDARMRKAEALYLANRGWTLKEFIDAGWTKLPISTYATIDSQISGFDFRVDVIVAGFGEGDPGPSIFTVRNPGISIDHTKIGFWCIGSGTPAAQMSLFSRGYSPICGAEEAAYYLLEAKINAENATGVSGTTHIHLAKKGIVPITLGNETLGKMRGVFEDLKPKPFEQTHYKVFSGADEFQMLRQRP